MDPEKNLKSPNLIDKVKEEIKATVHPKKTHHTETHGTSDDIDENTPIDYVKAPGIFERAKEEIEALIETIHPRKEDVEDLKAPNLIDKAKEELKAIVHPKKTHHTETHGTSDDIDEDTPIDYVKAPGVFERAKEEIEALIETIHPKKEDAGK